MFGDRYLNRTQPGSGLPDAGSGGRQRIARQGRRDPGHRRRGPRQAACGPVGARDAGRRGPVARVRGDMGRHVCPRCTHALAAIRTHRPCH